MGALIERIGLEVPIVQAGMGGGLAGARLAAAVSDAGGLGTIGILGPDQLRGEIAAARRLTDRPIAVNLLLPLARRAHFEVAEQADVLVTFWGRPRRRTSRIWIHQVGSVEEALAARAAGADGVIAQGVEAGGHGRCHQLGRGSRSPRWRRRGDRRRDPLPDVGGKRRAFRVQGAPHRGAGTVLTELFGLGWPAPHRVVPNAATDRWLRGDRRGPAWVRAIHRLTSLGASRVPIALQLRLAASQRPNRPLFGPAATEDGPGSLVDAGPLYAGESIGRIDGVRPAAQLVRALSH